MDAGVVEGGKGRAHGAWAQDDVMAERDVGARWSPLMCRVVAVGRRRRPRPHVLISTGSGQFPFRPFY